MSDAKPLMFTEQTVNDTPVTSFDLSHELKTTLDPGNLVPIMVEDTLPSDIFKCNFNSFLRLSPMTFPVFHRIDCYTHAFFVPSRILWSQWNEFIWNGDGKVRMRDQSSFVPPVPPRFYLNTDEVDLLASYFRDKGIWSQGAVTAAFKTLVYLFSGYCLYDWVVGRASTPQTQSLRIVPKLRAALNDYTLGSKSLPGYLGVVQSIDYVEALKVLLVYSLGFTTSQEGFNSLILDPFATNGSRGLLFSLCWDNTIDSVNDDLTYSGFPWLDPDDSSWSNLVQSLSTHSSYEVVYGDTTYVENLKFPDLSQVIYQGGRITFSYDVTDGTTATTHSTTLTISGDQLPSLRRVLQCISFCQKISSNKSNQFQFDCLIFRAYAFIYNEYYRDQNIDPFVQVSDHGGQVHITELFPLLWTRTRSFEHDYFTSCFPQQSRENYLLPVGLKLSGSGPGMSNNTDGSVSINHTATGTGKLTAMVTGLLDDLRTMMHLQTLSDKVSRAGSRVRESIQSLFPNTNIQDISPDQPVYIAGSSFPVTISEVTQTSASDQQSALGDYAGHGIATGCDLNFDWECREHGFVIVLTSIRPRTGYSQGLPKMFDRRTYLDYAIPDLATLGEQPVYNREIFSGSIKPNDTFGYIPRYSEYKYRSDSLSGDFRDPFTMSAWHLSRIFATTPLLNSEFIHVDSRENDRIFAYEDDDVDHYFGVFYVGCTAVRPLPMYANPTF